MKKQRIWPFLIPFGLAAAGVAVLLESEEGRMPYWELDGEESAIIRTENELTPAIETVPFREPEVSADTKQDDKEVISSPYSFLEDDSLLTDGFFERIPDIGKLLQTIQREYIRTEGNTGKGTIVLPRFEVPYFKDERLVQFQFPLDGYSLSVLYLSSGKFANPDEDISEISIGILPKGELDRKSLKEKGYQLGRMLVNPLFQGESRHIDRYQMRSYQMDAEVFFYREIKDRSRELGYEDMASFRDFIWHFSRVLQ